MLLLDSQPGSIIEQCLGVFNAIAQNDTARVSLYHRFTPQSMLTQSKLDDCPDEDFNYIPAKGDSESVSDDDEPINADQLSPGFPMSTTCSPRVFLPTLSTVPEHLAVVLNTFPNIPILATYEVLSVPHRFLPDSGDSGGIRCIPEEWKLAGGSANIAIPVVTRSGGIQAFRN